MKVLSNLLVTFIFGCSVITTCGNHQQQNNMPPKDTPAERRPPVVQIAASPAIKLNEPLKLSWKILNNTTNPIYVYSTLLQQPSFAGLDIDEEHKVIEMQFSRLKLWGNNPPPYYFPATEFAQINPGQTLEGELVSGLPAGKLVSYTSSDRKTKEEKIAPGIWQLRALIAYGYEIESVQKSLTSLSASGTGHPVDPVVKWQKIAYSDPVVVTFQK